MKFGIIIIAASASLGLSACADSTSTTPTKTVHTEARLGSRIPQSHNAAGSEDPTNPAVAGERAFPNSSAGGSTSATH